MLAGEFQIVNPWLLRELVDLGIWNEDLKQLIIAHQGSVQNSMPTSLQPGRVLTGFVVPAIPADIKAIYKVWAMRFLDFHLLICSLDRLGDKSEEHHRHVGGPRRIHLPKSIAQHPPC